MKHTKEDMKSAYIKEEDGQKYPRNYFSAQRLVIRRSEDTQRMDKNKSGDAFMLSTFCGAVYCLDHPDVF